MREYIQFFPASHDLLEPLVNCLYVYISNKSLIELIEFSEI